MTCRFVQKHLGAFVDGELDPATQVEFDRHIAVCVGCQERRAFEESMRRQVRSALGGARAPASLRGRIGAALDAAPEPEPSTEDRGGPGPLIRLLPLRLRHAVPLALAAGLLMAFLGDLPGGAAGSLNASTGVTPVLEDVVRLHSSELPADVRGEEPQQVARYFRNKVGFAVRPAEFDRSDVKLLGGRVSSVRQRRAAALYYDVHGRRVTVVVFDDPLPVAPERALRVRFGGRELMYQQVGGYVVPVRRYAGLNYAFTGDLDRETMLRLAASSRIEF
jgi:anti-sigma factor (TIGR02949 family)